MLKKYIVMALLPVSATFLISNHLQSFPDGAPVGYSGSPNDGRTCASCHGGSATPVDNIITSNIPAEGYTPGETYTLTVTLNGSGRKGFQVSPQKSDGTVLGTLTAGTGTQVNSGKWVTHNPAINTNPAIYNFTWTAPAAGTGEVNFYGAFAITRSTTHTDILTVNEKAVTGINENTAIAKFSVYPNPVVGSKLKIAYTLKKNGSIKTTLVDLTCREVAMLDHKHLTSGNYEFTYELPELNNGIYFVQIDAQGQILTKRILLNQ
jgi:hypothetical protein